MDPLTYQIDGSDQITAVSESWAAFARVNGAPQLAGPMAGRSIWEFIADATTRQVYRHLFAQVRSGRTVTFSYRCDSPALRRFMRMTMTPAPGDSVSFDSFTIKTEPRVPAGLLANQSAADTRLLQVCSWCKRVAVGDAWLELEEAIDRLTLFSADPPSALTHGVCPDCFTRVMAENVVAETRYTK